MFLTDAEDMKFNIKFDLGLEAGGQKAADQPLSPPPRAIEPPPVRAIPIAEPKVQPQKAAPQINLPDFSQTKADLWPTVLTIAAIGSVAVLGVEPVNDWVHAQIYEVAAPTPTQPPKPNPSQQTHQKPQPQALPVATAGEATLNNPQLAQALYEYMIEKGWQINEGKDASGNWKINIAYVDGLDEKAKSIKPVLNKWSARRLVMVVDIDANGKKTPHIIGNWKATIRPGRPYVGNPPNSGGAAKICTTEESGRQERAWRVGTHRGISGGGAHLGLLQVASVCYQRDRDRNGLYDNSDPFYRGMIGLNQHGGYNYVNIHTASAGCQVAMSMEGHVQFMDIIKGSAQYRADPNHLFYTTIVEGKVIVF